MQRMDAPATDDGSGPDDSATGRPHPPRRHVVVVGILVGALVVANNVGNIFITTLAEDHPAWLLLLNSTNRTLGLTTNQLDPFSYYGIATVRLLAADPLFFLLGTWYGDAGIRWVERRSTSQGDMLRMFERGFDKAAYPLVFLAPNNVVCLLAGATRMPIAAFVAVNLAGTLTRLYVIRTLGRAFSSPIESLLGVFAEYRGPLLVLSAVLVIGLTVRDRRAGRGELDVVREMDEELSGDG
jgi:membrane protein DedA with SNARE-associated domain